MKKIFLTLFVAAAAFSITAQTASKPKPVVKKPAVVVKPVEAETTTDVSNIKFAKTTHEFGTISQGIPVTYSFTFVNNNPTPITINQASATCGCTTPEKPEGPIAPGATGVIKVGFNAAAVGVFDKTITITTNLGVIYLKINGTVEQEPMEMAPAGM